MTRNPQLSIGAVTAPIKVALLTDDSLLRAGLSSLLAQLGSIHVVDRDAAEVALWDAGNDSDKTLTRLGELRALPMPAVAIVGGDDGFIVYVSNGIKLSRVSGSGGPTEVISDTARGLSKLWPWVLPGGRAGLFEGCTNQWGTHDLALLDLYTKEATTLVEGATRGWYLPTGHLAYATEEGALYAAEFDVQKRRIVGAAVPLLDNLRAGPGYGSYFAVSPAGMMA